MHTSKPDFGIGHFDKLPDNATPNMAAIWMLARFRGHEPEGIAVDGHDHVHISCKRCHCGWCTMPGLIAASRKALQDPTNRCGRETS